MDTLILIGGYVSEFSSYIGSLISITTAYILLVLAIAFYIYTFINFTIPKWIVSPIIAILVGGAFYIIGYSKGGDAEKAVWEAKAREAQATYDKKYLELALDLKTMQVRFNSEKSILNQQHNVEQQQLQNIIDQLQAEELAQDTPNEPQTTTPEVQIQTRTVYLPSNKCLSTSIPSSVLQSINKAGSRSK